MNAHTIARQLRFCAMSLTGADANDAIYYSGVALACLTLAGPNASPENPMVATAARHYRHARNIVRRAVRSGKYVRCVLTARY